VLYFVLADLSTIDVMYQFSLAWYQGLFTTCIDIHNTGKPKSAASSHLSGTLRPSSNSWCSNAERKTSVVDLNTHMAQMIERLTVQVYRIVSVALFAAHQLLFSFLLCSSIMRSDTTSSGERIEEAEWATFLQGPILANMLDAEVLKKFDGKTLTRINFSISILRFIDLGLTPMQRLECENKGTTIPRPQWVTNAMWRQCQYLEATFDVFSLLCLSIVNFHSQWNHFLASDDPYSLMQQAHASEIKGLARRSRFHLMKLGSFRRHLPMGVAVPFPAPDAHPCIAPLYAACQCALLRAGSHGRTVPHGRTH
jgi:dynein heavy chain